MMITMEEALARLGGNPDERSLELYITHAWVRPVKKSKSWYFEEIDVARAQLVHHLHCELAVEAGTMDIVLSLLDQLYGTHEQMRRLRSAIRRQPHNVRDQILALLQEADDPYSDA